MSLSQWFSQLQFSKLFDILFLAVAGLLCTTIHEVCHGWAAYLLGDPTAKRAGRLTLNPLKHIDLVGLLCIALVHFGWAKAVPINPRNFKNFRRDTAITALAGPLSNILLTMVALMIFSALSWVYLQLGAPKWLYWILVLLQYIALISTGLAVFNLIPIPPLDGSKILLAILPQRAYRFVLHYERYGFLVVAALLYLGILSGPLDVMRSAVFDFLWSICDWPYTLLQFLA